MKASGEQPSVTVEKGILDGTVRIQILENRKLIFFDEHRERTVTDANDDDRSNRTFHSHCGVLSCRWKKRQDAKLLPFHAFDNLEVGQTVVRKHAESDDLIQHYTVRPHVRLYTGYIKL